MFKTNLNFDEIAAEIKIWGLEFGFQQIGITDIDLSAYQKNFLNWIEKKFHGEMTYMNAHGNKRYRPEELLPGTIRVISARIDYLAEGTNPLKNLENKSLGYISRYALGRDYHKLIRKKLNNLAKKITVKFGKFGYRTFSDSAPILEKPLAEKAGLGWIGKHTNLIHPKAGSWFFLGEIFTDLPLPIDNPHQNHCGTCQACIDVCPTQAIVGPFQLDARRCISYLTIELRGAIPLELRPLIGNRIYGCDDCQLFCPWNKFAKFTHEKDFHPRHELSSTELIKLFAWTEEEFLTKTQGSAIRRIGYECWLRNIAVAMGNAPKSKSIVSALLSKKHFGSEMLKEHVQWALDQQIKL